MDPESAVEKAKIIPCWCTEAERLGVAREAAKLHTYPSPTIVEVGALYGGMTAIIGLSAPPTANIHVVDNFSWSPIKEQPASAQRLADNLVALGVYGVAIHVGDSRELGKTWGQDIDLLWIDGGHSYEYVHADLENFGPHAKRILLHDYHNPSWPSVDQAILDFLAGHPEWKLDYNIEQMVALKRTEETI